MGNKKHPLLQGSLLLLKLWNDDAIVFGDGLMKDEPKIVKILREKEKIGKIDNQEKYKYEVQL